MRAGIELASGRRRRRPDGLGRASSNPLDAAGNAIVGPGAPVVTVGPSNADLSTAPGSSPNSIVVTATNPNNCGPSPCDRGDALRLRRRHLPVAAEARST
jgi:hypothetical protein